MFEKTPCVSLAKHFYFLPGFVPLSFTRKSVSRRRNPLFPLFRFLPFPVGFSSVPASEQGGRRREKITPRVLFPHRSLAHKEKIKSHTTHARSMNVISDRPII